MPTVKRESKKSTPMNEHEKLRENIASTYFSMKNGIKQFLDSYNLTPQQYSVLKILRNNKPMPMSTSQITDQMTDLNADTSRVVYRLVNKGLVEKTSSSLDKRLVEVTITKEGVKLLQKIDRRRPKLDKFSSALSERQVKQLNKLLDSLRAD